jgi:hypothetical protein
VKQLESLRDCTIWQDAEEKETHFKGLIEQRLLELEDLEGIRQSITEDRGL